MENEKWYQKSLESIQQTFDLEKGLTDEQVIQNREKYGQNKLDEGKKDSLLKLFINQFNNSMIIILMVLSVISFFFDEKADSRIISPIVL